MLGFGSAEDPVVVDHLWILLVAIPLYLFFASAAGLYRAVTTAPQWRMLLRLARVFVYVGLLLGTIIWFSHALWFSRGVFFLFLGMSIVFIATYRMVLRAVLLRRRSFEEDTRRVLVVGVNSDAVAVATSLDEAADHGARVLGHVPGPGEAAPETGLRVLGGLGDLAKILDDEVIDEVVFAIPAASLLQAEPAIALCEEVGVTVHLKVDFVRTLIGKTYPSEWEGVPMLTVSSLPQDAVALVFKRAIDLAGSAFALLLFGPVILLAAAAVKLTSRGPAFFVQDRVGLNGRIFKFYKIRTMYDGADLKKAELAMQNEVSGPVFKMHRDPRVTPVGRWLRKFSIDETPQFWNVLKGDMSLVGPRPPVPSEVQKYERWQRRRLSMKPGLTCIWQVSGRSTIAFEDWMKLDLDYIDNWSLKMDLIILARTVPAVLSAKGAH